MMKKLPGVLALLLMASPLFGQTNPPVRLALVGESGEAAAAVDILTAQLSGDNRVQLLERDEIEKVYREQSTSAANRDDIKLGRILGADGLLLLEITTLPQTPEMKSLGGPPPKNLTIRLIAIKPGVILADGNFPWPVTNAKPWAQSVNTYLGSFFTKLAVSASDAVPLSVVNLHSAVQSADALETERQLKLLAIQRLSQEPQFFVLERQKMQLLGEEKNLKSDETPFWDGSYLLDGIVDQNGYSKDTITINARLTPSKGGAPLLFEVSGSRTNLAEVINTLALKVAELLKVNPTVKQWDAASEAARYFDEANWALKWKIFSEADADADSAWALGKQDLNCALVRVKAYTSDVTAHIETYQTLESYLNPTYDANGNAVTPPPSEAQVQEDITYNSTQHLQTIYSVHETGETKTIDYLFVDTPPNPENIDRSLHALELYNDFSRTSPDGEPKVLTRGPGWNDWHNSQWYQEGIEDLVAASQVLENFNAYPGSQKTVPGKLADLRALARSVAASISRSPSIHDGYFVGDRIATSDELSHTMEENPSIFRCEVNWGCFWQERPEDEISLYRELMSSAVFRYIHTDFWNRTLKQPRLVAWNDEDKKNLPSIWRNFMDELGSSTNVLWQMEAKALMRADATNADEAKAAEAGWWSIVRSNRDELIGNNVELFYVGWGFAFNPETQAMDEQYWQQTIPARKTTTAFEDQKKYLENFTPYDFPTFTKVFSNKNYTPAQAAELKPLVVAYESNLVATASGRQLFFAQANAKWVGMILEKPIDQILNPPSPAQPATAPAHPAPSPPPVNLQPVAKAADVPSDIITISKFIPVPQDGLPGDWQSAGMSGPTDFTITAHQWFEGKLLLDFEYTGPFYNTTQQAGYVERNLTVPGIAILDPQTGQWNVIPCPQDGEDIVAKNTFYHRSVLVNGEVFNCDEKQIRKYDFSTRQWRVLKISNGNNYELFAINNHLYAADGNVIFEITGDGDGTRILASTRRRPAVSSLDGLDNFGTPVLFAGASGLLEAYLGNAIYYWNQNDWSVKCKLPYPENGVEDFPDSLLFRTHSLRAGNYTDGLLSFPKAGASTEICLWQKYHPANIRYNGPPASDDDSPQPLWQMPSQWHFSGLGAGWYQSDLFLLAQKGNMAAAGYDAEMFYFSHGLPVPQKVFLKFTAGDECPPLSGINPEAPQFLPMSSKTWMMPAGDLLFFGQEQEQTLMPPSGLHGNCHAGVWLLPFSQLAPAVSSQKQAQLGQAARENDAREQAFKNLLAKYDLNHNGVLDPDEKEEALDDPAFIESELDRIDANHDGWLEAGELAYFDANHNQILDPKEQAGIDLAQHLLAVRLMNKYDTDGKGYLTQNEFNDLSQLVAPGNALFGFMPRYGAPGSPQHVDVQQVEDFLKNLTHRSLRLPGMTQAISPLMTMPANPNSQEFFKARQQQIFKLEVEYYWRNSGSHTN